MAVLKMVDWCLSLTNAFVVLQRYSNPHLVGSLTCGPAAFVAATAAAVVGVASSSWSSSRVSQQSQPFDLLRTGFFLSGHLGYLDTRWQEVAMATLLTAIARLLSAFATIDVVDSCCFCAL